MEEIVDIYILCILLIKNDKGKISIFPSCTIEEIEIFYHRNSNYRKDLYYIKNSKMFFFSLEK